MRSLGTVTLIRPNEHDCSTKNCNGKAIFGAATTNNEAVWYCKSCQRDFSASLL